MNWSDIAASLLASTVIVWVLVGYRIRIDLNMADEGYLWIGTLNVLQGQVPIRDFRAYDPGRYYLLAAWMRLLGENLTGLRRGLFATAIIGVAVGFAAVLMATNNWMGALFTGIALAAWSQPLYKTIDNCLATAVVLVTVALTLSPDQAHYQLTGAFAGLCFFFGLNHGIYATGGSVLLITLMVLKGYGLDANDAALMFGTGFGLGIAVPLTFVFLVPGVRMIYWQQKIARILHRGTANLPLAIPWIWRSTPRQFVHFSPVRLMLTRICFTLMPWIYIGAIMTIFHGTLDQQTSPREWSIAAASCVGLFYTHHAFSRADFSHLCQSIPPLLIVGALVLLQLEYGWIAVFGIAAGSIWWALWPELVTDRTVRTQTVEIDGMQLQIDPAKAKYISQIREAVDRYTKKNDPVLFAPICVTFYPLLERRPAIYDTFCVYPASTAEQDAMIDQFVKANARLAFIHEHPFDDRDDLRFSKTHPKVWEYLHQNLKRPEVALPRYCHVFVAREPVPATPIKIS